MTSNKDSRWQAPGRVETIVELSLSILYLIFQGLFVGITPFHVLIIGLFNLFFFAHPSTRKLAIALLPFVVFGVSYDWMRLYPNYKVNPIDIQGLYDAEACLFGITDGGTTLIPCEYFNIHHSTFADLMAGLFYLCWVPVPIAFGIWLYLKREYKMYLHFSIVFLFVNLIGFCGYYIHPAAPPWYAINYGFEPIFNTPGNVAGLGRFDDLVGLPIFSSIYTGNANIFAAVPSLHASYMLITTTYAIISHRSKPLILLFTFITLGIWWTAVYSCHHYIIDVLLGIAIAFLGILIFEQLLMRIRPFSRFINRYSEVISQ